MQVRIIGRLLVAALSVPVLPMGCTLARMQTSRLTKLSYTLMFKMQRIRQLVST